MSLVNSLMNNKCLDCLGDFSMVDLIAVVNHLKSIYDNKSIKLIVGRNHTQATTTYLFIYLTFQLLIPIILLRILLHLLWLLL